MNDTRPIPTREHAEGMLAGILAQREREGLTGPHPYGSLDLDTDVDRRIVASVYAMMAREALPTGHDCNENAVPYVSDGALGHGWECGICGAFLQAG